MANTYRVTDPQTGRVMRVTGDSPPSEQELQEIFSKFDVVKERTFGEKAKGVFDAAATMATSAMAQPVGGLFGLANLAINQDPKRAAARAIEMRDKLTYQPDEAGQEYLQSLAEAPIIKQIGETSEAAGEYAGRKTLDLTGSPALASIARGSLDTAGAALGAFIPGGIAARQGAGLTDTAKAGARAQVQGAGLKNEDLASGETSQALRSQNRKKIIEVIDADPAFYKAIDELGITAEPLASYASRNPQFRGIEQSFAALPNSPQNAQALNFAKEVSSVAHAMLETAEGAGESVATSTKWRNSSMKVVDELGKAADEAYNALNQVIDRRAAANPSKTMEFLDEFTKDLALGIKDPDVPNVIKKAYVSLQPRKIVTETGEQLVPPTFENMDRLRKNIGAAAFKKEGDFKDADSALLKRLYASLTDDINGMAEAQGLSDEVGAAKALVSQRKQLEERMTNILGKGLDKDIIPVVQTGLKGLRKGGAQRYRELMSNIPEPEVRTELVLTAIDDLFSSTRGGVKQDFGTTNFLGWYNDTLGKKGVRDIIAKDLPKNALAKLDNLAKISEGIARATAQKIPTGVVNSVLNDDTGMIARLVGKVKDMPGGETVGRAGEVLSNVAMMTPGVEPTVSAIGSLLRSKTTRAEKASELLADPEFSNMIKRAVAQGNADSRAIKLSEERLMQSAKYKAWQEALTESEKAKVLSSGLAAFLLTQDDKE